MQTCAYAFVQGCLVVLILLWVFACAVACDFSGVSARHTAFANLSKQRVNGVSRNLRVGLGEPTDAVSHI